VKKNGIEALHGDRDALKEEKTFTFFAARGIDATTESNKKGNGRTVDNAGSFNGNWLEMIRL